ncbi:MAG: DMT family transporter [Alphaproteobacteria bacterium]
MEKKAYIADFTLLLAAIIWGFAFAFQRQGMEYIGPFTYTAVRFLIGGITLLPFALIYAPLRGEQLSVKFLWPAVVLGLFLFFGAGTQQWALVYSTEANVSFITGLYVVFVPLICWVLLKQKVSKYVWIASFIMLFGMFLMTFFAAPPEMISGKEHFRAWGDILAVICAIFWSGHIIWISIYSNRIPPLWLATIQYFVCGFLALIVAVIFEDISLKALWDARIALAYGTFMSVCVAYTLQIIAQKNAPVTHATLILALESVFGALGGWLINGQQMTLFAIFGAAFMFGGTLIAEFSDYFVKKNPRKSY